MDTCETLPGYPVTPVCDSLAGVAWELVGGITAEADNDLIKGAVRAVASVPDGLIRDEMILALHRKLRARGITRQTIRCEIESFRKCPDQPDVQCRSVSSLLGEAAPVGCGEMLVPPGFDLTCEGLYTEGSLVCGTPLLVNKLYRGRRRAALGLLVLCGGGWRELMVRERLLFSPRQLGAVLRDAGVPVATKGVQALAAYLDEFVNVNDARLPVVEEGVSGGTEAHAALQAVVEWALAHRSQFVGFEAEFSSRSQVVGVWRSGLYLAFLPSILRQVLEQNGFSYLGVLEAWEGEGWLKTGGDGRRQYPVRVPGVGQVKMVVLHDEAVAQVLDASETDRTGL